MFEIEYFYNFWRLTRYILAPRKGHSSLFNDSSGNILVKQKLSCAQISETVRVPYITIYLELETA